MVSNHNAGLNDLLKQLSIRVRTEIDKAITEKNLTPRNELYFRWKIEEFKYDEVGVKVGRSSSQQIVKETWRSDYLGKINKVVKESNEFKAVTDALVKAFTGEIYTKIDIWGKLINLVNELVYTSLPDTKLSQNDIDKLLTTFLKRLNGEPLNYVAEVEITRAVILRSRIEFEADGFNNISLRQVVAEDLEHEIPAYEFQFGQVKPYLQSSMGTLTLPSAILTLECIGMEYADIVEKIKQSIAILRLFGVAGVDIVSHRVFTVPQTSNRSFGSLSSSFSGIDRYLGAFGHYQITEENTNRLVNFWKELVPRLPEGFFKSDITKTDYLTIAYERYCDALSRTSVFEARIANAVMGLEALLLPDSSEGELGFRLRTFTAKVLVLLGFDPMDVLKTVKFAYEIRSTFVHGSQLTSKQERKLRDHYSSSKNFSEIVLDYLRIAIVSAIVIGLPKNDFLALVNDSLVSEQKNSQLIKLLETSRNLIQ